MEISNDEKIIAVLFERPGDAKRAIESLREADFGEKELGILTHDDEGDADIKSLKEMSGNEAGKGAAVGAAGGAATGALWAIGIAAGVLPAIGPVIAGGTLAAIAASAAAGVAAGALAGSLVGLGVSDEEAAYLDEEFRKGRTLVVVKVDERGQEARTILQRHKAYSRYHFDAAAAAR